MTVLDEGLRRLYDGIAGTGLPFFVGGSVAAMSYGEPRATLDIDVVVDAAPGDAKRIAAAFDPGKFYVPHAETIRVELGRRGGQLRPLLRRLRRGEEFQQEARKGGEGRGSVVLPPTRGRSLIEVGTVPPSDEDHEERQGQPVRS